MASAKKTSPEKKPKATPNANPFGLTTRDIEIMIYAWKCLDEMGKIDKKLLASLTNLGSADSAGRQYRRIMAVIKDAKVDPAAPATPGPPTPGNAAGNGGGQQQQLTAAAVDAAIIGDPESPSVLASDKKNSNNNKKKGNNNKAGGAAPKAAGRKRVLNEVDDDAHGDGGGDGEGAVKNESDDGDERPKKIPKLALGQPIVTVQSFEAAQGLGTAGDEMEAGEA